MSSTLNLVILDNPLQVPVPGGGEPEQHGDSRRGPEGEGAAGHLRGRPADQARRGRRNHRTLL